MDKPLFTVVIPTYNRVGYLKLALESACNQTYENLEILVFDNGSTDGTRVYLGEISKKIKNIHVLYNERNLGFSKNIAQISAHVNGKYLVVLCDDDMLLPDFAATAMKDMEGFDNIVLWHCRAREIDAEGRSRSFNSETHANWAPITQGKQFVQSVLRCKNNTPVWCAVVYRVEAFRTVGGFADIGNALDFCANCCVATQGDVFYSEEVLSLYRQYPENLSRHTHWREWCDSEAKAFEKIRNFFNCKPSFLNRSFARNLMLRVGRKDWRDFVKMLQYGRDRYGAGVYMWSLFYLPVRTGKVLLKYAKLH